MLDIDFNITAGTQVFFISEDSSHIRYRSPKFPSLYFPIKRSFKATTDRYSTNFSSSYIYYVSDIWKFTVYWCLILYPSAYILSGIVTLYNLLHVHNRIFTKHPRKVQDGTIIAGADFDPISAEGSKSANLKLKSSKTNNSLYYFLILIYLLLYPTIGLVYGVINGTVIGFLLGILYRSGLFGMSTWVPLCVSCCSVLYTILSSYRLFGYAM